MSARENAAKAIEEMARKAKPVKPEPRRRRCQGKLLYSVTCPRCVELRLPQTIHMRQRSWALGCKAHERWLRDHRSKARVLEEHRRHYARHKAKRLATTQAWRERNRERMLANVKDYYERNREAIIARKRERYRARKDWRNNIAEHYTKLALI